MEKTTWLTVVLNALAILFLFTQSCDAQTVSYQCEYYQPGNSVATRMPLLQPGGGEFVNFPANIFPPVCAHPGPSLKQGPNNNVDTTPISNTYTITIPHVNVTTTYSLAYTSVTGGLEGSVTAFKDSSGHLPATVPVDVGNSNIVVTFFYFQSGGGGGCPKGVFCPPSSNVGIGEFSETVGALEPDLFVKVYSPSTMPNADPTLTRNGNLYGVVNNTDNDVRISAYQNTASGNFDRWVSGQGTTTTPNSLDLIENKLVDDSAIALYHSTCPPGYTWNQTSTVSQCLPTPPDPCQSLKDECFDISECAEGLPINKINCEHRCEQINLAVYRCEKDHGEPGIGCSTANYRKK